MSDHARGCEGRNYTCTCGHDDRMATDRRTINEAIGFLRHFKADAEAGRACIPETVQKAIDHLQAAIAEPAPSPLFQHMDFRGQVPALQSAMGERGRA